ncbi:MAG: uroporphyrinogen decarboxylase family protein [Candidatus Humimicrobiaceae bacterium]
MNSRARVRKSLLHKQPDILPVDIGGTTVTSMHVSIVYKLRQYYALDIPGTPVKVVELLQMLGEIKDDFKEVIGVDCTALEGKGTIFGFNKENWKEWKLFDGTPVLVPGLFNTELNEQGGIYQYAEGDRNYPPTGVMPKGGFFFDSTARKREINEKNLNPKDNLEGMEIISNKDLTYLKNMAEDLYNNTDYSIVGVHTVSSLGDVARVPGPNLKDPKGIRDVAKWYISLYKRKDYIKKVFEGQTEIALENYRRINKAMGRLIDTYLITGTDFGFQQGILISKDIYKELFKPFHKKINDWIHENTSWKCFIHTCGSICALLPEFIEAGFDILNPVQISAKDMEPDKLKKEFGKYLTFWGGGVNTQKTLSLGSPKEVKEEVKKLIEIFNVDGGFIFSAVHNIQANVPIENVIAMIEVIQGYRTS